MNSLIRSFILIFLAFTLSLSAQVNKKDIDKAIDITVAETSIPLLY